MGPFTVTLEADIFNSTILIVVTEAGQVVCGSLRYFDSSYLVFRCVYDLFRMLGVLNWKWEMPNEYVDFDFRLYHELMKPYKPHLRVKYPAQLHHPLCIENLWSNSYMKVYPSFHLTRATAGYPTGETTAWVDSLLNKVPNFNLDIIQDGHETGEALPWVKWMRCNTTISLVLCLCFLLSSMYSCFFVFSVQWVKPRCCISFHPCWPANAINSLSNYNFSCFGFQGFTLFRILKVFYLHILIVYSI